MNFSRFHTLVPLLALASFFPLVSDAQSLTDAHNSARTDLDSAIRRLANTREVIASEKVQLNSEVSQAKEKAASQRRDLERLQRLQDNAALSLDKLREENLKLEEDLAYVSSLFRDYAQEFDVNLDIAEKSKYQAELNKLHASGTSGSSTPALESQAAEIRFLQTALNRLTATIGGQQFTSESILSPEGQVSKGDCILIGPFSFFSGEGNLSGLVQTDKGPPLRPRLQTLQSKQSSAIEDFALNGTGELPFDPTLHDALQVQVSEKTFLQEIKAGGLWIWPILFFAVVSFVGACFKAYEVFSIHNPPQSTLDSILAHLHEGKAQEAKSLVTQVKGPFRPLLENAVEFAKTRKEILEEILFEKILEAQPQLERFLPFIAVTAAATPLLGLLGTVTGMILTFDQITLHGTSDTGKLAGGISEALVTTKFGLIAAIPALVLHALLSRRVQGLLAGMEKFSTAFINGLQTKQL